MPSLRIVKLDRNSVERSATCTSLASLEFQLDHTLTHVALVHGRYAGMMSMEVFVFRGPLADAGGQRDLHVSRLPLVSPALSGQSFAGLEVWEHLLGEQLRWVDRNGVPALHLMIPREQVKRDSARLSEMGGRLAQDEAFALQLPSELKLIRMPPTTALRWLQAKAAAGRLLERIQRATSVTRCDRGAS